MADFAQGLRYILAQLLVSTVNRKAHRGQQHGGLYVLDLAQQSGRCVVEWADPDIEWLADGSDRGLRGVVVADNTVYVATSNELLAFSREFKLLARFSSHCLREAHALFAWQGILYLVSAGYDSVLGFDLAKQDFTWGIHVKSLRHRFQPAGFDPGSDNAPLPLRKLGLRSVFCNAHGMYISGEHTGGMLHFNGSDIHMAVHMTGDNQDARPFRDGVLFNDNDAAVLRYTGRGEGNEDRGMPMPESFQPGSACGLCALDERRVAGGSAPATITVYDLAANETLGSVQLSSDPDCAIHSITAWPGT